MMRSSVLWDGFSRAASSCFSRAFQTREYDDVTLVSEDFQEFGAHRVILASASEKFRKILQLKSHERNPLIFLRGLTSEQVSSLLHFIYEGKVDVETQDLANFINIVTEFEIDGLKCGAESELDNFPKLEVFVAEKENTLKGSRFWFRGTDACSAIRIIRHGINLSKSSRPTDFTDHGGFYLSNSFIMAHEWSKNKNKETAVLVFQIQHLQEGR